MRRRLLPIRRGLPKHLSRDSWMKFLSTIHYSADLFYYCWGLEALLASSYSNSATFKCPAFSASIADVFPFESRASNCPFAFTFNFITSKCPFSDVRHNGVLSLSSPELTFGPTSTTIPPHPKDPASQQKSIESYY